MRGRTNINIGAVPVVNANIEEFVAEEEIKSGSFVEPIYGGDAYGNNIFDNNDFQRKILKIGETNYFLIVYYNGSHVQYNDKYYVGIYTLSGINLTLTSAVLETGFNEIFNFVYYKDNTFLLSGKKYDNSQTYPQSYSKIELYKFDVDLNEISIKNYSKIYSTGEKLYSKILGHSSGVFVNNDVIDYIISYSYTKGTYPNYECIWHIIKINIDNNFNISEQDFEMFNEVGSGASNVPSARYVDGIVKIGDKKFAICLNNDGETVDKIGIRCIEFSGILGEEEVKNSLITSINPASDDGSNFYYPIMIDQKNYIWTVGEYKIYKEDDLFRTFSNEPSLDFGSYYRKFCYGVKIRDGLCILKILEKDSKNSAKYSYNYLIKFDKLSETFYFSKGILESKPSLYDMAKSSAMLSDNTALILVNRGFVIFSFDNDELKLGEITNKVKNYTKNSNVIGFAKTSGNIGDKIKVYVPNL